MAGKTTRACFLFLAALLCVGCAATTQNAGSPVYEKIEKLSQENQRLIQVKDLLEQRLSQEIADHQVSLKMMSKGLVVSFVSDILFDSGKAKLRPESFPVLDKVAEVLKGPASQAMIGVEGHTDDQPIRYSSWKSNWELSAARALGVLHYLIDKDGIDPSRLSVSAFGEYRPAAPNGTKEGSQLNRRVEIVILPELNRERRDMQRVPENIPEESDPEALPEQTADELK